MTDEEFFAKAVAESRAEYDYRKARGIKPRPAVKKISHENRNIRITLSYTLEERLYFNHFKAKQERGNKGIKKCNVPECLNRQYNSSLCERHRSAIRYIPKEYLNG